MPHSHTSSEILGLRLSNQQILDPKFISPQEVIAHMGAIQAQDYAMSKWAIGLRMKNGSQKAIELALDKGQILRTHLLRPTWHLVSAKDIYWMLELTGPRIKKVMRSRNKQLGLSEAVFKKSNGIISKALETGEHLSREELLSKLQAAKIQLDENRASHLFLNAELEGIICSGRSIKNKGSYALLENRVTGKKTVKKEEALAKLASVYFKSRGPATLADFTWWSGLSITEAKMAVELIKGELDKEGEGLQTYYFHEASKKIKHLKDTVHLLPAFDEFLISYKDRSAVILQEHQKKAFSSNGIFWPTLLVNGKVKGLWKRTLIKDKVIIETDFFEPPDRSIQLALQKSAASFGNFLTKELQLLHK